MHWWMELVSSRAAGEGDEITAIGVVCGLDCTLAYPCFDFRCANDFGVFVCVGDTGFC